MGSGHCRYLNRNKSSCTVFIFVLHMHLQISISKVICRPGWGGLSLVSKARPPCLTGCRGVSLFLTVSLCMFHFTYCYWPSNYKSACLADKQRILFYALWLGIKAHRLTCHILRTLLSLLYPQHFCLLEFSILKRGNNMQCFFLTRPISGVGKG